MYPIIIFCFKFAVVKKFDGITFIGVMSQNKSHKTLLKQNNQQKMSLENF